MLNSPVHIAVRVLVVLALVLTPFVARRPEPAVASSAPATPLVLAPSDESEGPGAVIAPAPVLASQEQPGPLAGLDEDRTVSGEIRASARRALNGDLVTVSVVLRAALPTPAFTVSLPLPAGLDPVDLGAGQFLTPTRELQWRLDSLTGERSLRFVARVNVPDPPALLRLDARADAGGAADRSNRLAGAKINVARVTPGVSIGRGGGRVSLDDRITLDFAPGALAASTVITAIVDAFDPDPATDIEPVIAFDASPSMAFAAPVTLTLSLAGARLRGRQPTLRYLPDATGESGGMPEVIPSEFNPISGVLTARLYHFSTYFTDLDAPAGPKPWKLVPNLGGVNAFRGSATFNFPLDVPPMHDGLEPRLALQYSSAAAEKDSHSPGGTGMGWSFDGPTVRQRARANPTQWSGGCNPNPPGTCYGELIEDADDFTLELNGQQYALAHKGGGEFVAESFAPLRIWYCASQTSCATPISPTARSLVTHTFWVWLPDGTLYVFGGDGESMARLNTNSNNGPDSEILTWHLRYVFAAHRDDPSQLKWSAKYSYYDSLTGLPGGITEYRLLRQVEYGNSLIPGARFTVTVAYTERGGLPMPMTWQPVTVTVMAAGQAQWSYVLAYGLQGSDPMLAAITKTAPGGVTLPPATFGYRVMNDGMLTPTLLVTTTNGYGASVVYAYGLDPTPDRADYRVLTETTRDAGTGWIGVRTFDYAQPCHNLEGSVCRTYHDFGASTWLMGYAAITETVRGASGPPLSVTSRQFHVDYLRLGRERVTQNRDGVNPSVVLSSQRTDVDALGCDTGLPDASWLVATVTQTQFPAGDVTGSLFSRSAHRFDFGRANCARLYQGQISSHGIKFESTGERGTSGGAREERWRILRDPLPGTQPLLECRLDAHWIYSEYGQQIPAFLNYSFVSMGTSCSRSEGFNGGSLKTFKFGPGEIGYSFTSSQPGFGIHLVLCQMNQEIYKVRQDSCEAGYTQVEDLGYVAADTATSLPLATLARVSNPATSSVADNAGILRTSASGFAVYSSTARWLMRPITEVVRDAAGGILGETHLFYDGLSTPGQLDKGDLTFAQRRASSSGSASVDVGFVYTASGLPVAQSFFKSYGTLGTASNASGERQRRSNVYDPQFGLFTVAHHTWAFDVNPQTQTVRLDYFGVDGVGLTNTLGTRQPLGAMRAITDPNGAATAYGYDVFGRLARIAKPGDSLAFPSEQFQYYDGADQPVTTGTVRSGYLNPLLTAHLVYAAPGQLASWSRTFYDGLGRPIQTQAPFVESSGALSDLVQFTAYDALGQVMTQSTPYTVSAYVYDTTGGLINTPYVPNDLTRPATRMTYDALGRTTVVTAPDGGRTLMAYAADTWSDGSFAPTGLFVKGTIDANNHGRHDVTDAFGRLVRVREFTGTYPNNAPTYTVYAETKYAYDTLDNLRIVTDALTNTTVITYEALGRKTAMRDPDMGVWSYAYDANGNLITQTDALSQSLAFAYDGLNRMTQKKAGAAVLASYGYDFGVNGIGRRITATVPGLVTDISAFDARGRVLTQTRAILGIGADLYVTRLCYDGADRMTGMTLPTGEVITQTLNAAGQLTATRGLSTYVSAATYNPLGAANRLVFGNGVSAHFRYFDYEAVRWGGQPFGKLRQVCVLTTTLGACAEGQVNALLSLLYEYDPVGNITSVEDRTFNPWQSTTYTYDPLDRLLTARGLVSETYGYNQIGNMVSKLASVGGGTSVGSYTYGDTKPHAVTGTGNGWTFTYDANGNMTRRVEGSTTYTQAFNVENQLSAITRTGNVTLTQQYDADGARVRKTEGATTTLYLGAAVEVIIRGATRVTTTYYFFGSQRTAMRVTTGTITGTVTWLHGDHLGSASLATNASGAKVAGSDARYTPFGEYRTGLAGAGNASDNRFTGQKRLTAGWGLDDFNARMYSAALGRFISADTIVPGAGNPQALNRYAYVFNNPLMYNDPTGHDPWWQDRTPATPNWNYACGCHRALRRDIVTPRFINVVQKYAVIFQLPAKLVAANAYAEMNSYNFVDDYQDRSAKALLACLAGMPFACQNPNSVVGGLFFMRDTSYGPLKIKPSAALDEETTAPSLRAAGYASPNDRLDAVKLSLEFVSAVRLSAAHLKGLADLRKGDTVGTRNSRTSDMTTVDMQIVRVAYNEGLRTFRKLGNNTLSFYRSTAFVDPSGRGAEVAPWFSAFDDIFGP